MSRLLEGDVGSGKTAVAAATAYAVMAARMQVAYMCPTEILATQHFESFIQFFSYMPIQIGLITSSGCRKFPSKVNPKGWTDISRAQLMKWVADGSIAVLIGTHALIQKSVVFKNLAFAIIDEQHRFGMGQRAKLIQKNAVAPHLLSMTATPIPRTLALTMYGDLDLTLLDQSPAGRKPIITELVTPTRREPTYEKIRQELQVGRQLYVICPRINEPDPDKEAAVIAKSVKEEAKRLKASVFPEYEIGILHSKMTPNEKDRVMGEFKKGKIHILCATSVVEVGVNVPNATVIIIEGAERFGLAQLHQLRGRVMRSTEQAYCYAFTETTSARSIERLKALQTAKNGFELAELDLSQRGAGELSGARQWGVSDIAMEALQNLKMVEAARIEAARLIRENPKLSKYPVLKKEMEARAKTMHFE
jgi:ATP-dependent DNA helicase RecG